MGPYYKYMNCPEDFLKFEDIVGDYYICSDDYLDEVWTKIPGHPGYYISNYGRAYLDNLTWGTQQDNWYDSVRNGTAYTPTNEDREKGSEKVRIPVKAVNLRTGNEMIFRGQSEAARELGLQQANVWKVLNGQRPATGGYYFEYLEKDGETDGRDY